MDVRLRFMADAHGKMVRATGGRRAQRPQSYLGPNSRKDLINTRVHGGNLRDDAILIRTDYPLHSHQGEQATYANFITRVFPRIYGLELDDALWLARKGDENEGISHSIDWLYCIEFTDAYVYLRDLALEFPVPANYGQVAADFQALTNLFRTFIRTAKANPVWNATNADLITLQDAISRVQRGIDTNDWTGQFLPKNAWQALKNTNYRLWNTTRFIQGKMTNRRGPVIHSHATRSTGPV